MERYARGEVILDLGFAGKPKSGWMIHEHLQRVDPKSFIIGGDINKRQVHALKAVHELNAVVCDALHLPFRGASIHVVNMGEILEHLWNPKRALEEVHYILKENGKLCVTTPNALAFMRILRYVLRGHISLGDRDHKFLFDKASLTSILAASGFSVIAIRTLKITLVFRRTFILNAPESGPFSRLGSYLCVVAEKHLSDVTSNQLDEDAKHRNPPVSLEHGYSNAP